MSSKEKVRLTELLVFRGLCEDTAEAERAILAGHVLADDTCLTQPGALVDSRLSIRIKTQRRFASRGGDKLFGALEDFAFDPTGKNCLDVGASTGGFTDCLLQCGAAFVVAIDVAYGQFAWSLRQDKRVRLLERTNIRKIDPVKAGAPFDLIVADLSFTSLRSVLPVLAPFSGEGDTLIALVKPQFELSPTFVDKGIVSDPGAHIQALEQVIEAATSSGFAPLAVAFSHITGSKGNIEFFLLAQRFGIPVTIDMRHVAKQAHERLGQRL